MLLQSKSTKRDKKTKIVFQYEYSHMVFPADDFTSFINENHENSQKFDIKIIDQPTIAYIQKKEDKIHVGFSTFIDDIVNFMVFPGRVYNSNERQIIMDKDNMEKVVNLCKESGYQVEIRDVVA